MQVAANGVELALTERGRGRPVLLLHGFPETAFSWRHQIPALAGAGLRAVALDLRGFGDSDKPEEIAAYRLEVLVADVVGVLDALGLERAALVGHDWGSIIAWEVARAHPGRVERLVSLNVPYRGHPGGFPPTSYLAEHLADRFGYVLMFQEPGVAEAWFAEDLAGRLASVYRRAAVDPDFLTPEELETFVAAFREGGMRGPLNLYRNIDVNAAAGQPYVGDPITVPALVIAADSDPVLPVSLTEGMERWVPDLRVEVVERCGHWTQQERPEVVSRLLVEFLAP